MPYWDETHQTAAQRDKTIIELRKRGYTYRQIAKAVGMAPSSVQQAMARIAAGRPGRALRLGQKRRSKTL
jgi:IS30 family transposase